MTQLYVVIAIIVAGGIIGGWAAYLVDRAPGAAANGLTDPSCQRFLLLGVVASACVPLFLSLLQSQLVGKLFRVVDAQGGAVEPAYEDYLIFLGLCLVAAFSARTFIDSVTRQVLRRLDEVQETAEGAADAASDAKETAREALGEAESADHDAPPPAEFSDSADVSLEAARAVTLTPAERKALEALALRTYRTRTGVADDSGIAKNRVSEVLESLLEKRLAMPTKSPNTGGARWTITKLGEAALGQPS